MDGYRGDSKTQNTGTGTGLTEQAKSGNPEATTTTTTLPPTGGGWGFGGVKDPYHCNPVKVPIITILTGNPFHNPANPIR